MPPDDRPSAAISGRPLSLVNLAMFTVDLQVRRVRGKEPEDEAFVLRWWADLEFLIVTLRRLRRAAALGLRGIPETKAAIEAAIAAFDGDLPDLATMRNVAEHIDDYVLEGPQRRHRTVERGGLQVGSFENGTFRWLKRSLNVDHAQRVAERLYLTVRGTIKAAIREERIPAVALGQLGGLENHLRTTGAARGARMGALPEQKSPHVARG